MTGWKVYNDRIYQEHEFYTVHSGLLPWGCRVSKLLFKKSILNDKTVEVQKALSNNNNSTGKIRDDNTEAQPLRKHGAKKLCAKEASSKESVGVIRHRQFAHLMK